MLQEAGQGPTGHHFPLGTGKVNAGPVCVHRWGAQSLPARPLPNTHVAGSQRLAADGAGVPDGQCGQVVAVNMNLWGRAACGMEGPLS